MMFTGPRTMNSYPYQTNHMPSTHYCHPNWEPVPMQAKENSTAPLMHEPWPCYHGCQVPMACPNCLNQVQCPNPYYIRPHCQQFASPPPHFYGGYYPPYPQPCHVGYVPPPHYSMELPRYEYDKNVPSGFHCCGCPNHNLKEEKSVKIEEHEPDIEAKKSSGSLVPSGVNNFSYPVLWIPSEYGANKEKFRSADNVGDKHGKQVPPCVTRPQVVQVKKPQEFPTVVQHKQDSQPAEQDSTNNGWFPLDMDSLRKLIESGVGAKTRGEERRNVDEGSRKDVQNKNQHKQLPYNIIWLPYDGQGEKEEKIASTEPVEKASAISRAVPSKSEHPDNETEKIRTEESGCYSKTVPVKKLQECVPKSLGESKEQKEAKQSGGNVKTIPVKQLEEFVPKPITDSKELKGENEAKGKTDDECGRKSVQSSSPTKKSKLPPICLRVDPPKKKNGSGNGSSRSPSPPGDKKRQSPDDFKTSGKSEAMQPSKKDIKVEAKDESPIYNKIEVLHVPQNEKKESVLDKSTDSSKEEAVHMLNGDSDVIAKDDRVQNEDGQGDIEKGQGIRKPTKKSLSETDAALVIQSTYRGYGVRKTEPLKKLRQIAKIRDEVHEVRKRVEDLFYSDGNSIDKERVAIGETIMKLLLKLDTIQGLLPSIRDLRKCVAKELILLQEKLDSITCQNATPQETRSEEQAQHSCMDEDHKDDVEIRNESSLADFCKVEASQVNFESANEFSKDSIEGEGSEYNASISDESSEKSVQDEGSQTAEQLSILSESSHEVDMNVNQNEGELAYGMNQVPSSGQPPTSEDVVCDSENKEILEGAPVSNSHVNVDLESGSLDEVTVLPPGGSLEVGAVKTDSNVGEKHPEDAPKESVVDDATPNGMTLGIEGEPEYLLAELPRNVLDYDEMNKETPEKEADMEGMLMELPIQVIDDDEAKIDILERADIETQDKEKSENNDAGPTFSPEAALGDTTPGDRDADVDLLAELPHELPELVAEELHAEISRFEVSKHSSKVENSSESCELKPELGITESRSVVSSIDIDVPIVEHGADEGVVPRDEGLAMCDIASKLNEETKATQSPEIDYDQDNYCGHKNGLANDQWVGAETVEQECFDKNSESEVHQTKDEDETSELSSESRDLVAETKNEEVDKKIIEENERMKEMLDKLVAYGKQQQDLICSLNSKVEDLEKRLAKKKAVKGATRSRVKVLKSKCGKSGNGLLKERAMSVAS